MRREMNIIISAHPKERSDFHPFPRGKKNLILKKKGRREALMAYKRKKREGA